MEIFVAIALISVVTGFVAWPFFAHEPPEPSAETQLHPLERQKLEAYAAIKEAEFDHQMGKLNEADFATLRDRYMRQALGAIAKMEVAAGSAPTRITKDSAGRRPHRIAYCPSCGGSVPQRAHFCAACGRELKDAAA